MGNNTNYCLIMAGGKGTRFWPESTTNKPKQYLSLVGERSLLQQSLDRFDQLIPSENRYVVTVKDQELLVKEHTSDLINKNGIIFEPTGRNTAPCILLSLAKLVSSGATENDVVTILPADHVILNKKGFQNTLSGAISLAVNCNSIVTIGIRPSFPHTGYGYIHFNKELVNGGHKVEDFKEKPNFETAKNYVQSGEYFWNAGMFVSTIGCLLKEFKSHSPEIYSFYKRLLENINKWDKLCEIYQDMPADSIDYAVMEKSNSTYVVPADFDWNDLGSWDALEGVIPKQNDNTLISKIGSYIDSSKENIVFAPNQFISLVNVNNLIVVSNEKALVVMPKDDCQKVKQIVQYLEKEEIGKNLL